MYNEAEQQLTEERKMLFEVETKIKSLLSLKISLRAETTLSLRATQLAAMWLGKAKGALGIKTPYTQSYDPKSVVIENRADTVEVEGFSPDTNEVAAVKELRAHLNNIEKAIDNDSFIFTDNSKYQLCIKNAYTNCCEATMWLGMVLNVIKTENENPQKDLLKVENPKSETTSTDSAQPTTITLVQDQTAAAGPVPTVTIAPVTEPTAPAAAPAPVVTPLAEDKTSKPAAPKPPKPDKTKKEDGKK